MDVSPSISSSAAPLDAVWFASAASYYRLLNADTVDILYTPGINNWNGFDSIQLRVVSAKAEQPRDIDAYIEKGMRYFCNGLLENLSYRLSEPEQLPEICETTLAELCSRSISGLLVLVFSVESAKKILDEIRSSQIGNVDICYSCVADSPVCCNTVLLAPQLANLPAFGFSKVVFYDNPPCSGGFTPNEFRFNASDAVHEQRLRQGRTAFCLRSRFHGLQLQACAVNSCCFTLFAGGALRQDVQQAERSCLLCAVRRSGIYRAWLYRIHSGRCTAEQQRNSACAAVRQHFIFRCRTFAHAQFPGLGAG